MLASWGPTAWYSIRNSGKNEANVSFLGFGDPTLVTWGRMLLLARQSQALLLGLWWWFLVPGLMIMLLVISVFMIGRAYEEALNPELSEFEV